MINKEKVIKGLKLCVVTGDFCGECPYDGMESSCIDKLHDDALTLLKEQEEEIDKAFQSGVNAGLEAQWASEHI
jgi:hypothetical protein